MRRLKRGRLVKIAGVLVVGTLVILVIAYLFSPVDPLAGYVKGHPEYCEHFVTDNRSVRLAFTPYAKGKKTLHDEPVDPNNWKDDPFSHDFMPFHIIEIPLVDYEVTQDGGQSWTRFWRYENQINEWAWCDAWGSLNADNFWVWARSQIAVTHDGGDNWIVQDGRKEWNTGGNMTIEKVIFDTPVSGQIIFVNWPNLPDPTLLSDDGGKTWHPDPNWTAPHE